jgi:hypothetical protein
VAHLAQKLALAINLSTRELTLQLMQTILMFLLHCSLANESGFKFVAGLTHGFMLKFILWGTLTALTYLLLQKRLINKQHKLIILPRLMRGILQFILTSVAFGYVLFGFVILWRV